MSFARFAHSFVKSKLLRVLIDFSSEKYSASAMQCQCFDGLKTRKSVNNNLLGLWLFFHFCGKANGITSPKKLLKGRSAVSWVASSRLHSHNIRALGKWRGKTGEMIITRAFQSPLLGPHFYEFPFMLLRSSFILFALGTKIALFQKC